eukprot:4423700-Amphidinium_carterae.1
MLAKYFRALFLLDCLCSLCVAPCSSLSATFAATALWLGAPWSLGFFQKPGAPTLEEREELSSQS